MESGASDGMHRFCFLDARSTPTLSAFSRSTIQDVTYLQRPTIQQLHHSVLTLADAVRRAGTGDATFQNYLRFIAKFPKLSAANSLLVQQQRPTSSFVRGFKAWRQLDRTVKRGEKAIWIYAPIRGRYSVECDPLTGEESWREWLKFKPVAVFDVSQTVGAEWEPPNYSLDLGEQVEPLYDALVGYANSMDVSVERHALLGALNGLYSSNQRHIVVNEALPVGIAARTLTHEIAHHLLWEAHADEDFPRAVQELEAEAVAAVVWMRLGYGQVAVNSGAYIANWNGNDSAALILKSVNRIALIASALLHGLMTNLSPDGLPPHERIAVIDAAAMEVLHERDDH